MRLSTEPDRDDGVSVAVLHAALDAGVTLLDTADVYCWNDEDLGHNERLIAQALTSWPGDRSRISVATKGGLTRPDGRWVPDGRGKHLAAACEASCRALDLRRLPLYQLHVPDPRVPLATSVRALAALKRSGLIERIGLCNVTVAQIEEASRLADVESIQVEVSLWQDRQILGGVLQYCVAHGLQVLAYRPLGGVRLRTRVANHPVLRAVAAEHQASPADIALAWVASLSPSVVPLVGTTRMEHAQVVTRYRTLTLDEDQLDRLDELCPPARVLRGHRTIAVNVPVRTDAEIVMVMGVPGAGKSTLAQAFVADGYTRLNRDVTGGSLRGLVPALDDVLESGASRVVLDNTYVTRASRTPIIRAAAARGIPVRGVWLSTPIADAQVNAATRIVQQYGKLLDAAEIAAQRPRQPAALLPATLFRYQRELEPPDASEGFAAIEVIPFQRRRDPSHANRAVIIWCDGVLLRSRSGERVPTQVDDVTVDVVRGAALRSYAERGFRIFGLSWQPTIGADPALVHAVFARMNELLGIAIAVTYCPHPAGPPQCWCRKPLPGMGVLLIHRHQLDPGTCIYVGDGVQDAGYAERLGFQYQSSAEFFGSP